MFRSVSVPLVVASLGVLLAASAGAAMPAPPELHIAPTATPVIMIAAPFQVMQPAKPNWLQGEPADWASRMVRNCVKSGSRVSC
jgi:hypothetical protein